ncbi:hypothetical protein OK006_3032 [Actinobacteria bacterium OK006]|nr:hypothetical protein OK006_3032 [Actinobacteria bacterium OK006]
MRLDRANGTGWQPLSKKLHRALSGGEKAIALYLPLFAAAAHYEAVPLAPRPILLDGVFVGVDAVNRGQVFALLTALDPAGESAAAEVPSVVVQGEFASPASAMMLVGVGLVMSSPA